ncbi:hypothetical protein ABT300_22760 [Streptomyces sp. NPDC001027]|uniref:hypothetical protein n=1 Tax=Streptomyces sp. NPDC001027 TaxID=3154771 RepID=UPI00332C8EDB
MQSGRQLRHRNRSARRWRLHRSLIIPPHRRTEPWINQIETWFGILTRQSIRRGTFASVNVLITQIHNYIDSWNSEARPFTWTATAGEILAKVRLVQTNIKKLVANNSK